MSDKPPACRGFRLWATQEDSDKLKACRTFSEEDNMKKRNHQQPLKSDQKKFPRVSRRAFTRMASALAGVAALPFYNESSLAFAQLSKIGPAPEGVMINANENPLG